MGYQESILHIEKKNQIEFIKELQKIYSDEENWQSCAEPIYIIDIKQDVQIDNMEEYTVVKGEKLIYIGGERFNQKSLENFIGDMKDRFKSINNITKSNIIPVEDCMDFCSMLFDIEETYDGECHRVKNEFADLIEFKDFKL
ncbi:MAG: hypothetical protein J6J60_08780 [Clostridia bacterium]|nr:hypothetical protein [Clostridia bacterium]MBP3597467.1 hypothetical protein [Clostridia bacterium]